MNNKKAQVGVFFLLAGLSLVGLIVLNGCKKKSEPSAPPETQQPASTTIEQTTCPVMGGAVNKNLFVEYKEKKVYFCCAECKTEFGKNPEKYLDKLPQFAKQK